MILAMMLVMLIGIIMLAIWYMSTNTVEVRDPSLANLGLIRNFCYLGLISKSSQNTNVEMDKKESLRNY